MSVNIFDIGAVALADLGAQMGNHNAAQIVHHRHGAIGACAVVELAIDARGALFEPGSQAAGLLYGNNRGILAVILAVICRRVLRNGAVEIKGFVLCQIERGAVERHGRRQGQNRHAANRLGAVEQRAGDIRRAGLFGGDKAAAEGDLGNRRIVGGVGTVERRRAAADGAVQIVALLHAECQLGFVERQLGGGGHDGKDAGVG